MKDRVLDKSGKHIEDRYYRNLGSGSVFQARSQDINEVLEKLKEWAVERREVQDITSYFSSLKGINHNEIIVENKLTVISGNSSVSSKLFINRLINDVVDTERENQVYIYWLTSGNSAISRVLDLIADNNDLDKSIIEKGLANPQEGSVCCMG